MSLRLRIFIAAVVVLILIMLTKMIKNKKLDLRDSLIWYFMCFIALLFDAFPVLFNVLASLLGIDIPANMVFMFAIIWLIFTVFTLSATISRQASSIRRLTQELALLKNEFSGISGEKEQDDKRDTLRT